jgi:hypothetical protein
MASKRDGRIIETTQEVRQAERGPTVRNLLVAAREFAAPIDTRAPADSADTARLAEP